MEDLRALFTLLGTETRMMTVTTRRRTWLYVNKATLQWVVMDEDGKFWVLPYGDEPWARRQEAGPPEPMDLEPVPGHYKHMLGIPG